LSEFATEQQNPGNTKHVTQIAVRIPEPRLKNGVVFVDTPGLGSLATWGAAETKAYLPRCDLGIILIDAASTLTDEDLAVARMLYDSGATAMVLLSKADLLTPAQREQAAGYIHQHLLSDAGIDVPVHPVSVVGTESRLADEWFESSLLPMFQRRQELASVSLRRKIGALREAVVAALSNRLEWQTERPSVEMEANWEEANLALTRAAGMLDPAWRQNEDLASEMSRDTDAILETAADYLAKTGTESRNNSFRAGEVMSSLLTRVAGETGSAIAKNFTSLRAELTKALQVAAIPTGSRMEADELPEPTNLPVIDLSPIQVDLELKKPFSSFMGKGFLGRYFLAELKTQCSSMLDECLRLHEKRLKQWSQLTLAELRRAFEARAESLRLQLDRFNPSRDPDPLDGKRDIEQDLHELQA
jgi:GTP-binding protein EngB required for normal cell division